MLIIKGKKITLFFFFWSLMLFRFFAFLFRMADGQ